MTEPENPPPAATAPRPIPLLTYAAIAVSLFVFVAWWLEPEPWDGETLRRWGVLNAWDVYGGGYGALVTSVFAHGDILHLAFNLYWLWYLGRALEGVIGFWRSLVFFVVAAWVSSAFQLAVSGDTGIGLSGVGYAMFGFTWIARPRYPSFQQVVDGRLVNLFLWWLVICIAATYLEIMNVGNTAHFTGLLFGGLLGGAALPRWRRLASVGAVLLCTVSIVTVFWAPWSAEWTSKKAMEAKGEGDYERAIALFTRAIELDPSDAFAYDERGWTKLAKGDHKEAVPDFTRAIELDPTWHWAYGGRGQAQRLEGYHDGAILDFTRAIELEPSYAFAWDERGWTKNAQEDYAAAIPDFTRAIELDPGYHWSYGGRGQARRETGDHGAAVADFTKAIELEPSYTFAYTERGYARFAQGDHDGATADYARAIELDPSYQWAYDGFNEVAWFRATTADPRLRDSAGAVELARKAVAFAPTSANFRNTLGAALYSAGRYGEAVEALEKAGELRPGGDAFDWFVLAMVRHELGKDDARGWYDKAVAWAREHNPDDEELRRLRAQAEEVLGVRAEPEQPAEGADGD